ncbi:response regulator [Mucilaginibacter auburnensis]|uniref:Response regulator receiver domain-containing protein n=1 Tax=Mucilaginibacter auburnensis TaxID=1457233 RepID=A0A2H9VNA0_9SPHI|nr:response regulator [Mucilaginibacter auburnensis]PJJ79805.1 response regulator receiver domain-containing protein [Mucilaginibacter auburnensis]
MTRKVLVIDDNNDLLDLLREALSAEGYEVDCLPQIDNIYEAVLQSRAGLIIVDFILDGINGGELCHQIKINPRTSHIPVIMISGYTRVLESLGGDYGADHFLSKPFDLSELVDTVNNLFPKGESVA